MKRNYLLTLLCVLVAISVNAELRTQPVERFNSTTTFDRTDLNKVSNGVYTNSVNHVTFTIDNLHSYDGERLRFNNVGSYSSKTSNFAWIAENGYNVQVTGISGKVRGYQAKISTKGAYAKFNLGDEVKCNTNSTGRNGARDISISDGSGLSKPVVLTLRADGNSTDFTMHTLAFTYRVTQDVPVFQYKSIASGSEGGDVYSSWESHDKATAAEATHEQYDANVTNAASGLVQTAFFKAVPRTGYVFIGWKRKADDVDYVSTRAEYSEELISKSNDNAKPATITLYAVFSAKNTPLFSGSNQSLNVGANQVTDFAFQYTSSSIPSADASTDFYYTIDQNPDATTKEGSEDATQVVSYDPVTNTLTGRNSGTAVITFTQKESANYYAASQSYNITVNKNTGTLTNNLGTAYKVDDAVNIVDCYTASNSEVEVQVASSNTDVIALVEGKLKALSVGTATVTFKQAETYKWTELTASQEITVTKYDLSASISQSDATWDATINNPFAISHDLNDYTVEALDPAIATYTDGAIQTYAETGTAHFVISRAEDYKYNQLAETLSISVAPKTESEIIYQDNTQYNINYGYSHTYTVSNVLPGDVLTVDFWESSGAQGGLAIYGYVNEAETEIMPNTEFSTTAKTYTFALAKAYTSIKIQGDGGGLSVVNKHCKNFTIRRNLHISADNSNVNMESTISTNATATISLDYGSLGSTFKVVSNNPKITVSPTSFNAEGSGTKEITLTGDATALGTETATITIYDQSKKTTVNVTSTITRIPQTITWNSSFENLDVFSTVTLDATASGATTVTYSIAEEDQAKAAILENVLSFNEAGTVHVVATAAQSDIYEGVSDTVSVEVRLAQPEVSQWPTATLTYGQTLTDVVLSGESKIEGTFQWGESVTESDFTAVKTAETYTYDVKFVPKEGRLFNTLYGKATITIVEATQTISWENAPTACKVGERIALEAVASSGLAVEYYVDQIGNYAKIDAERNELVALANGAIQLRVSQAGEAGKYVAAKDLVLTIDIEAGNTTATEQVSVDEQVMVRKVMRDGVLYILRDGQCYDTCGRLVDAE